MMYPAKLQLHSVLVAFSSLSWSSITTQASFVTVPLSPPHPHPSSSSSFRHPHSLVQANKSNRNNNGSNGEGKRGFGTRNTKTNGNSSSSSPPKHPQKQDNHSSTPLFLEKTYNLPIILPADEQAAMSQFFSSFTEWHPLFASIALHDQVPAWEHLNVLNDDDDHDDDAQKNKKMSNASPILEFHPNSPWKKLPQIPMGPEKERHMEVISSVLDNFQKALVDIPMSDKLYSRNMEEDNELHFIEEGRRLLVLERFQVVEEQGTASSTTSNTSSSSSSVKEEDGSWEDVLFGICWSEIHHLVSVGSRDTGSLIILNHDDDDDDDDDSTRQGRDLAKFVDEKIRLPLRYLGLGDCMEVASFARGKNCVRLIHQLGEIPSLEDRNRDGVAEQGFE
jgi:hypothetical protein